MYSVRRFREGRGRALLREGCGEVVHEDGGVAGLWWAEGKSSEVERGGEVGLRFGFVV